MHRKYADQGLVIIGVNLDNDLDDAARFLEEYPPNFRIRYDTERTLAEQFEVMAMLKGQGAESFLETQGVDFWCSR